MLTSHDQLSKAEKILLVSAPPDVHNDGGAERAAGLEGGDPEWVVKLVYCEATGAYSARS